MSGFVSYLGGFMSYPEGTSTNCPRLQRSGHESSQVTLQELITDSQALSSTGSATALSPVELRMK